jgi:hypothetical protein
VLQRDLAVLGKSNCQQSLFVFEISFEVEPVGQLHIFLQWPSNFGVVFLKKNLNILLENDIFVSKKVWWATIFEFWAVGDTKKPCGGRDGISVTPTTKLFTEGFGN